MADPTNSGRFECFRAIGIDPKMEYDPPTGRPIQIVHDGNPIREVLPV